MALRSSGTDAQFLRNLQIVVDSQNGNATYGDVYKIVEKDLPAAGFHLFPPKKRARLSSCPLGSA
jgi:hypothetical protein